MVSYREAAAAIYGAWRLARLDPKGLSYFHATEAGFWRSFFAAVLCAPGYIVIAAIDVAHYPVSASDTRLAAVHLIAYAIRWTAFPLVMISVTRALGRETNYLRHIVARNWSNVLGVMVFLPAIALASGAPPLAILPLLATVLVLAYQWYVARSALAISGWQAAAVIGLDLLIDMLVVSATRVLLPTAA